MPRINDRYMTLGLANERHVQSTASIATISARVQVSRGSTDFDSLLDISTRHEWRVISFFLRTCPKWRVFHADRQLRWEVERSNHGATRTVGESAANGNRGLERHLKERATK